MTTWEQLVAEAKKYDNVLVARNCDRISVHVYDRSYVVVGAMSVLSRHGSLDKMLGWLQYLSRCVENYTDETSRLNPDLLTGYDE